MPPQLDRDHTLCSCPDAVARQHRQHAPGFMQQALALCVLPQRRTLETFARTPLMTYYLRHDYGGQDEPHWHMVDEPFDYPPLPTVVTGSPQAVPESFILGQNHPNPFNASTLIEYRLPQAGPARIEIFNSRGQLVEVLVDRWHAVGSHTVAWDAGQRATGTYFYRFLTEGFQQSRKMLLVR